MYTYLNTKFSIHMYTHVFHKYCRQYDLGGVYTRQPVRVKTASFICLRVSKAGHGVSRCTKYNSLFYMYTLCVPELQVTGNRGW